MLEGETSRETVAVFGSTGSIGTSTLDVLERNQSRYQVAALTANSNVELIFQQCLKFKPATAAMATPQAGEVLARRLKEAHCSTTVLNTPDALSRIAADPTVQTVMASIVGFAGLQPTITAAMHGKRILLANKEAMVVAGELLNQAARDGGSCIIPVDSEHNAIFQCLPENNRCDPVKSLHGGVSSLVLTASGGPFRQYSEKQMQSVTLEQALSHPNWEMGQKVTIDSATLMNKGLEVIEASYLFGVDESLIEVVVHPESTMHSMVRYVDGSVLAQLGQADMRTPIANALAWPDRIDAGVEALDFVSLGSMHFEAPDMNRFPCLALARQALRQGNGATGVLNGANEVAVEQFINGRIGFTDIPRINASALQNFTWTAPQNIDDLLRIDQSVRQYALEYVDQEVSLPMT